MLKNLKQNPDFQFMALTLMIGLYASLIFIVSVRAYFGVLDSLDGLVIGLFFLSGVLESFNNFLKDFDKWIEKD